MNPHNIKHLYSIYRRKIMEMKYDIVIAGAGPAGMMAGIKAAENGNDVLILEKNTVQAI